MIGSHRRVLLIAALALPRAALADGPTTTPPPAAAPAPAPAPASAPAPAPPPAPAASAPVFTWQPFGYLRAEYIAVQNDPNVAFVGRNDGFELQNARIGAIGTLGTRARFVVSFDGALDERADLNSPQGTLAVGLRDSYLDVGIGGGVVARGGYFQCWVDPQAQVPDTRRAFVDLPLETRGMRATEGWETPGLPPGRSIGVALRRDPGPADSGARVGFELAAQNGADEFSSNNDNDNLALSAAALVRFPHDGWLVAAARWNPRTVGELPFRQDETDLQASVGLHVALGPIDLGGGLILQHTTFDTTGGPSQDSYGGHGELLVRIPMRLPLAVGYRFAILDPSSLVTTDQVMEHTAGAVLGVPSLRMRLQLQLVHVEEQAARELSNDRAQLAAEVVL